MHFGTQLVLIAREFRQYESHRKKLPPFFTPRPSASRTNWSWQSGYIFFGFWPIQADVIITYSAGLFVMGFSVF